MVPELCRKYYAQFFEDNYQSRHDLRSFFLNHQLRPKLEAALIEQIHGALKYLKTTQDVKQAVYDIMLTHCNLVINERERQIKKNQTKVFDQFGVEKKPTNPYKEPELPDDVIVGTRE